MSSTFQEKVDAADHAAEVSYQGLVEIMGLGPEEPSDEQVRDKLSGVIATSLACIAAELRASRIAQRPRSLR